jgi:hypothetical protein
VELGEGVVGDAAAPGRGVGHNGDVLLYLTFQVYKIYRLSAFCDRFAAKPHLPGLRNIYCTVSIIVYSVIDLLSNITFQVYKIYIYQYVFCNKRAAEPHLPGLQCTVYKLSMLRYRYA